jgi:sulfofructose kinase
MKRVVGLGASVLDTLIECGTFPTEDTKMKAERITVTGGGPVGNALIVMSKLGVDAAVLGVFARDSAGDFLLSDYEKYGVDTKYAVRLDGRASFTSYIVLSKESGTRTCMFDRGTVGDDPSLLDMSALDGADLLHLDGNYMKCAIAAARRARELGVTVSLDAGGRYAGIEELLPLVDILIPSCEFALGITGTTDIPSAMRALKEKYSPKVLAVTDGARGGYYYDGDEIKYYSATPVVAVDTNGAGDTFHGAFAAAYLDTGDVGYSCRLASAVSAYKCMHTGAREYKLDKAIAEELVDVGSPLWRKNAD